MYKRTQKWKNAERKLHPEMLPRERLATKKRMVFASATSQALASGGRLIVAPNATVRTVDGRPALGADGALGSVFSSEYACPIRYNDIEYPSFIHALSAARWDFITPASPELTKKYQGKLANPGRSAKVARELGSVKRMRREKVAPSAEWRPRACGIARALIRQQAQSAPVREAMRRAAELRLKVIVLSPPEDTSWGAMVPKSAARDIIGRNELGNMWNRELYFN